MSEIATPPRWTWPASLLGLALIVFGVVALTGPGRIDIVDGQTRYEAAKGLVEHGSPAILNPAVEFAVFPGRNGERHTYYRLPQTAVAVAAILLADATGPTSEARRQFLFSLHGAAAAAALVVTYAVWFRRRGFSPAAAAGWAAAGIFCTPNWYYATSTFDDILGTSAIVIAMVAAGRAGGYGRCLAAGLMIGLALNCKQPLGIFLLPVLAACDAPTFTPRIRMLRSALVLAGVAVGAACYIAYDEYKFPGDIKSTHAEMLKDYGPAYIAPSEAYRSLWALAEMTAGLSSGVLWYASAAGILGVYGAIAVARTGERRMVLASAAAAVVFVGFISWITFYKGDPSWGPRYLTPVLGFGWLLAPEGAAAIGRGRTRFLLIFSAAVQLMGLSVDPMRLYLNLGVPPGFGARFPELYFRPEVSHLLNRPREMYEAVTGSPSPEYNLGAVPTAVVEVSLPPGLENRQAFVRQYQVLNGLRFWWAGMPQLPPERRPVDLVRVGAMFAGMIAVGVGLLALGLKRSRREPPPVPEL